MKKLLVLATAGLLISGVSYATYNKGKKKKCSKSSSSCCSKSSKSCKKDKEKTADL